MKTMTCDDAFEALTGPREFSAGDLEQHLAGCARCREMSDVLSPALALFAGEAPTEPAMISGHGATGASARMGSAGRELLSPAAVRAADHAARELGCRSQRQRSRTLLSGALRLAAVFLLGVATAFGIAGLRSEGNTAATESESDGTCLWAATDTRSADTLDAEHVILSCVACHLPATGR